MVSMATPTMISSEVPPISVTDLETGDVRDDILRHRDQGQEEAPASVMREITRSRYSNVGLPGRMPGM